MAQYKHKTCSHGKQEKHEAFRDGRHTLLHTSCMAEKPKNQIAVEMGRRLAEQRTARDWTQKELARQTGWRETKDDGEQRGVLTPSQIGNFEQGTRRIRHEEALILSQVFGLPAAYFLAVVDEHEARVLSAMRQPPPHHPAP